MAFRIALIAALAGVVWLFRPFLATLLAATVVVMVAWPLHAFVLRRLGGRSILATATTMTLLVVGVFGPIGTAMWILATELGELGPTVAESLRALPAQAAEWLQSPVVERQFRRIVGDDRDPALVVGEALRDAAAPALQQLGNGLGAAVGNAGVALINTLIFFLTVGTLFQSGPDLADWARRVSPVEPRVLERVWITLSRFSRGFVLAALVTGAVQGLLAGLSYAAAGVEGALVWGVLTGLFSVVPVFGTGLVWIPLVAIELAQGNTMGATGMLIWCVFVVGTIDNVIRPLIIGETSQLHPLLVFLAVFGGILTLGVSGLLVGPMLVATLLALLSLYEQDLVRQIAPLPDLHRDA